MPVLSLDDFAPRTTAVSMVPAQARRVGPDGTIQRLRFHRGRTLTAAALRFEAANHEARFGLACRALNDGIVEGFSIALADQAGAPGAFTLGPGYAIGPSGQDLTLGRPVQAAVGALPRRGALDPNTRPATPTGVGVLMIEPVSAEETRFIDDADRQAAFRRTAQLDPAAAPYQDARIVDGVRLTLVVLEPLAALLGAPGGANRAAHLLAEAEAAEAPLAGYARSGVALALLGVGTDGRILWISRHGAARRGGGAPQPFTKAAVGAAMPPRLRQAQVDALLEALNPSRRAAAPTAAQFRHLPPAGVVPAPGGERPALFPPSWRQTVAPIPLGQLDAVFRAAEALAPYDLTVSADEVRWYVPVPDALFEPGLLTVPAVDPAFLAAVAQFRTEVADALARRNALRGQAQAAEGYVDTDAVPAYTTDADAVEGEAGFTPSSDATAGLRAFGAEAKAAFDAWAAGVVPALLTAGQRGLIDYSASAAGRRGLKPLIEDLSAGLDEADDLVDFGFTRVQADIYRLRQTMLDNEEATKLVTFPVLAGIAKGSNALATNKGLVEHFLSKRSMTSATAAPTEGGGGTAMTMAVMAQPLLATEEARLLLRGFGTPAAGSSARTSATPSAGGATLALAAGGGFSLSLPVVGLETPMVATAPASQKAYAEIFKSGRSTAAEDIALSTAKEARAGIALASAIPGAFQDQRTLTIASRLQTPAALSARVSALRIKADALLAVNRVAVSAEGVTAAIVALDADMAVLRGAEFQALFAVIDGNPDLDEEARAIKAGVTTLAGAADTANAVVSVDFRGLSEAQKKAVGSVLDAMRRRLSPIGAAALADLVLARRLDPDPATGGDESAYLESAITVLESVVAIYRAVEGRVAALRAFIDTAQTLVETLSGIAAAWREALDEADRALAEARHDFRAATALLAEEQARVVALEARRRAILAKHVRIMVFARPRHLAPHGSGTTSGRAIAGVYEDPLPSALAAQARLPGDLAKMMEILRDVPVGWFAAKDRLMEGYREPKALDAAFHRAANAGAIRYNAGVTQQVAQGLSKAPPSTPARPGKRGRAVASAGLIATRYVDMSRKLLAAKGSIDLGQIDRQGWAEKRRRAEEELSLDDLISGSGSAEGATAALAEIEAIGKVVSALFARLRAAPAAIRLLWADRLSVYDGDPVLTDVTALPGWFGLDAEARNAIGQLHGWLFRRMAKGRAEAQALMSDVMQVAALLAANAETDEIVSARLTAEVPVGPGDTVELSLDRGTPAIGTAVWFGLAGASRVQGIVRDVLQDKARVEIAATAVRTTLGPATPVFLDTRRARLGGHGR